MPAIAVVAAIGTVSAGAALGGVLGGIMIAGGVMSGVGAVTGNKTLSTLGAVASLGAGLGSAMGLADAANAAWNGAVGADSALAVTGKSFLDSGGSLSAIGDALGRNGGATQGITPTQGGNSVPELQKLDTSLSGPARADGLSLSGGSTGMHGTATGATGNFDLTAGNPQGLVASRLGSASSPINTAAGASDVLSTGAGTSADLAAAGARGAGGSFIDKSLSFINKNPGVAMVGGQLAAGGLAAYSQQKQQEAAIQAQEDARKRYNDSILNQRRRV